MGRSGYEWRELDGAEPTLLIRFIVPALGVSTPIRYRRPWFRATAFFIDPGVVASRRSG